jgi:hypothetical protein
MTTEKKDNSVNSQGQITQVVDSLGSLFRRLTGVSDVKR